jgi:hypothetical protein
MGSTSLHGGITACEVYLSYSHILHDSVDTKLHFAWNLDGHQRLCPPLPHSKGFTLPVSVLIIFPF